jgi:hypothetical protein
MTRILGLKVPLSMDFRNAKQSRLALTLAVRSIRWVGHGHLTTCSGSFGTIGSRLYGAFLDLAARAAWPRPA